MKLAKRLIVASCLLLAVSVAHATEYDGIWFLGFNVNKPPFNNLKVRQAVVHALDRNYIAREIMSEEAAGSYIPPGLNGYDAGLAPYKLNLKYAKTLLSRAKYAPNDARLKKISLLHTDGVKTVAIAHKIQEDLRQLGILVYLVQISYRDETRWEKELSSGNNNLFLMGYKTSEPATGEARDVDGVALLEPLFKTKGEANFTGFSNSSADMLFDQLSVIAPTLSKQREIKLREINKIIYKELPAVVLFNIEKL